MAEAAPADYDELYRRYFPLVCQLATKQGISFDEVEAVGHDVLAKVIEKDYLKIWHTGTWSDGQVGVGGSTGKAHPTRRKASFKHWFALIVLKYLRHYVDRERKALVRNPVRLQDPVGDSTWGEEYAPTLLDPDYDVVEQEAMIVWVLQRLGEIPTKGPMLVRLLKMCVSQTAADGQLDRKVIAREFGVSDTTVGNMVKSLRKQLESLGVREV